MATPSYVTLATLKLALGINTSDATRDPLLQIALDGAARAIYRKTGKRRFDKDAAPTTLIVPTWGRSVWDRFRASWRLPVPDIATQAGLLVKSEDGVTSYTFKVVTPTGVDEPITDLLGVFPVTVAITATFGWPSPPGDIVQAQLLQAMRYYRRKDSPEGIAGSAEWGLVRVPRLDPDVAEMIEDYCLPAVA